MTAKYPVPTLRTLATFHGRRRKQAAAGTLVRCDLDSCRREYSRGHGAELPWVVNGQYCSQTCLEQAKQRGAITSYYRRFKARQTGVTSKRMGLA